MPFREVRAGDCVPVASISIKQWNLLESVSGIDLIERIFDGQSFDPLAVPQVFAIEGFATSFECGSNDEGILKTEPIAGLQVETAPIKRLGRVNSPQRYQNTIQ